MLVLALITGFVLHFTRLGRYVFAIGGNEHAAIADRRAGRRIKVAVYMISALSAGIAGVIETGWLGAVTTNLGPGMELQVIAATVIGGANLLGGVGTAFGALIGSALIEVIRNSLGLLGISAFWQGTFVGTSSSLPWPSTGSGISGRRHERGRITVRLYHSIKDGRKKKMTGKRIVFTGGTGKAGRHVVPYLKARATTFSMSISSRSIIPASTP